MKAIHEFLKTRLVQWKVISHFTLCHADSVQSFEKVNQLVQKEMPVAVWT